ncbi:MAG: ECF transporter S component, partial [Clostridia bacterium]|nr:ECF transporter S component [Clostridia bacterium]
MSTISRKEKTKVLVLSAVLTALVVVLQLLGSFIKLGPFSISLVLIPIVLGAATCGKGVGAWLGLTFGVTVLLSGDAAAFMSISVIGTIVTVLAKGLL